MDEITSFLEHPLDKGLYKPKRYSDTEKKPLRILVTEAGTKPAYNIIYKICSGSVFGPDQEIILHLINSRGVVHHKCIALELAECGFSSFKDCVLSSDPADAFKNVDIVIAICTFEEIPGLPVSKALLNQSLKAMQLTEDVLRYGSEDCKIIFTGSATKTITAMLTLFRGSSKKEFIPNISGVTCLDTVISKALLAAKLKTTTDRIKDVITWGITCSDVRNATVLMYPPDDFGDWEMKNIPILEAIHDHEWLNTFFLLAINKRVLSNDLLNYGKAVASSTVFHLKTLFSDSDYSDEIFSMSVVTPINNPYGLPPDFGFSFPVKTKKGKWKILPNLQINVSTQLNLLRIISKFSEDATKEMILKIISFLQEYDITRQQFNNNFSHKLMEDLLRIQQWTTQYFILLNPAEGIEKSSRPRSTSRKSVVWDDTIALNKNYPTSVKSSIRFSAEVIEGSRRDSKMNISTKL